MKQEIPTSSHLLVLLQLAGIALSCYPVGWMNRGSDYALILCLLGVVWGIYAMLHNKIGNFGIYPELRENAKLIKTGPYKHVRHPMYGALITMMIGIAMFNQHQLNYVGVLMVCVAVIFKAQKEEEYLMNRFPEYGKYQKETSKLFPFMRKGA